MKRPFFVLLFGVGLFLLLKMLGQQVGESAARVSAGLEVVRPATVASSPVVALTFDDGPSKQWTEGLLNGLKERNVKATFFLIGANVEGNEPLVERMVAEGHLIGNHTYSHVQLTTISTSVAEMKTEMETMKDEITCNLRIESSRGTVFKNNAVSTVLSAVIYRGSQRITDMATLKSAMGSSAYLQWSWQRLDETNYGIIAANDSRIGNNGFTFTLSPEDVDTKVTFMCELIT